MRIHMIMLCALFLTACSSIPQTGNVIDPGPVKNCGVPGFSCFVEQDNPNDIGLSLQNNMGFALSSVIVILDTTDCDLQQTTIDTGAAPKDAIFSVHYTCASGLPDVFSAKITLQYLEGNGASKTVTGRVNIKN